MYTGIGARLTYLNKDYYIALKCTNTLLNEASKNTFPQKSLAHDY